jgi:hypothetical protein
MGFLSLGLSRVALWRTRSTPGVRWDTLVSVFFAYGLFNFIFTLGASGYLTPGLITPGRGPLNQIFWFLFMFGGWGSLAAAYLLAFHLRLPIRRPPQLIFSAS